MLAHFALEAELGRGAFGDVRRVRRLTDRHTCACKRVGLGRLGPEMRKKALQEADLLRKIHSPYVVQFLDSFLEVGDLYILTEMCDAGCLAMRLKERADETPRSQEASGLCEEEVSRIATQVLLGLEHLHDRRVLHRDIKPANIFLLTGGGAKLGDLGVAKELFLNNEQAHTVVGSPAYMAPEVLEAQPYGTGSDIWSFGVVGFEMCALRKLFEAPCPPALYVKILHCDVPPMPQGYSEKLRSVFGICLQRAPHMRPSSTTLLQAAPIRAAARALGIQVAARAESPPSLSSACRARKFEPNERSASQKNFKECSKMIAAPSVSKNGPSTPVRRPQRAASYSSLMSPARAALASGRRGSSISKSAAAHDKLASPRFQPASPRFQPGIVQAASQCAGQNPQLAAAQSGAPAHNFKAQRGWLRERTGNNLGHLQQGAAAPQVHPGLAYDPREKLQWPVRAEEANSLAQPRAIASERLYPAERESAARKELAPQPLMSETSGNVAHVDWNEVFDDSLAYTVTQEADGLAIDAASVEAAAMASIDNPKFGEARPSRCGSVRVLPCTGRPIPAVGSDSRCETDGVRRGVAQNENSLSAADVLSMVDLAPSAATKRVWTPAASRQEGARALRETTASHHEGARAIAAILQEGSGGCAHNAVMPASRADIWETNAVETASDLAEETLLPGGSTLLPSDARALGAPDARFAVHIGGKSPQATSMALAPGVEAKSPAPEVVERWGSIFEHTSPPMAAVGAACPQEETWGSIFQDTVPLRAVAAGTLCSEATDVSLSP